MILDVFFYLLTQDQYDGCIYSYEIGQCTRLKYKQIKEVMDKCGRAIRLHEISENAWEPKK